MENKKSKSDKQLLLKKNLKSSKTWKISNFKIWFLLLILLKNALDSRYCPKLWGYSYEQNS